ncbi:hypothetical protein [Mucilaginibacter psychrotolerans]|uniref:Uncharacterized protein n=1 Tax=Mucilaginibacter psychrotolerans TaxID=1524096 RepID=A0A4Y8S856_9SPHI|nr:hypothetical protein [Mucilaginibacter psychrotolerans]TFF34805.1 hypothetical protein E2R66_20695 [Mucilaginibacter psychrotolerans]
MCYVTGYTLVIPLSQNNLDKTAGAVKAGQQLNPFAGFDFTKGNWQAFIVVSPSDFTDLHPSIQHHGCIKTGDRKVLMRMKKDWKFRAIGGDMATFQSTFYVVRNHKVMFESGIVLDKQRQGLQNPQYGWMEPVDAAEIISTCKQFKAVYWPIVFL